MQLIKLSSIGLLILLSFASAVKAQSCLLVDRIDDFAGNKRIENNYWLISSSGNSKYGINANKTDTVLFDFIFKPYDGACGEKLRVMLEDIESNKIVYDSTYTPDEYKHIYLTKYPQYSDHLVIRLNLENHGFIMPGENGSRLYRLKIEAIDNKGKSTLVYGRKDDKLFVFNNEPN